MPFNLGPEKILVILVFALIFLGPDKLPEAARKIGELVGHARRMSGGLQSELRQALDDPLQTFTREFAAGEQTGIAGGAPSEVAGELVEAVPEPAAEAPPVAGSVPTPTAETPEPEPTPEAVNTTPVEPPAAPNGSQPAKPALPSWVFPGGGANGPGFH